MAISAVSDTTLREAPPPRRQRLLEDERWLAFVLLVPTIVLLGLFIALSLHARDIAVGYQLARRCSRRLRRPR
ncbi:hypothetical protein ABIF93_006064 [Bradyrhizobium japonicum]